METVLGLQGPDFVMIAADTTAVRSIVVMKADQKKIYKISNNLLMATTGHPGDTVQFTEYISKNLALYKMRNTYNLKPKCAANFTRNILSANLRSRSRYEVNLFIGGYDEKSGPELHYIDYLANAKTIKHAGHGYGSMFCNSIFDNYYNDNLTQEQAYDIFKKCITEIQKRLVLNLPNFNVAVVDKDGVRDLPQINSKSLLEIKPLM